MRKKFISTALAASVTVPNCAPWRVNSAKAASSENERIMMSRLSDSMRRKAAMSSSRWRGKAGVARKRADHDGQAKQHGQELAGDGRPGDAGNAPAELQAKQEAERDVDAVEHQLQHQAEPALAAPQHIAEDGIVDQREGCGKQPDPDIDCPSPR